VSRDERALEARLTEPTVPPALATGELEILGLLPRSSNYTFLARATAGDEQVLAVYKPRRGETPLWDFPDGTLCRREVAAYVLSVALGWPNVPPTVLRDGPEGEGSVQLFVDFDPAHHFFTLEETHADEFRRVAIFDVIANNADRKSGHCLLAADGRVWVVDHGVCFSDEPKLRTVIWDFAGEPVPESLLADLRAARAGLDRGLGRRLGELVSGEELDALAGRLDATLALGLFPEPGPGRPYPWPPV
jgi:uncharacterized repeat protein (TIGR03843 family)